MTTAVAPAPAPPVVRTPQPPAAMPDWWAALDDYGESGTLAIPLAEFGKSLADTDLDAWLENFAARNADSGQTYAISHTGELLIMPPTGHPGVLYEGTFFAALYIWTDDYGGVAFPANARFRLPDGSRLGPDAAWFSPERQHLLLLPDNRPFPLLSPISSPKCNRRPTVGGSWWIKSTFSCATARGWPGCWTAQRAQSSYSAPARRRKPCTTRSLWTGMRMYCPVSGSPSGKRFLTI